MFMSKPDSKGSPPPRSREELTATTEGLLSALKLASWMGLEMWVRDVDGTDYRVHAPVIIGSDFVQFATGMSLQPVFVPLNEITAFELP